MKITLDTITIKQGGIILLEEFSTNTIKVVGEQKTKLFKVVKKANDVSNVAVGDIVSVTGQIREVKLDDKTVFVAYPANILFSVNQ